MAERPSELGRFAHVEQGYGAGVLFDPFEVDFPHTGKGEGQRSPGGIVHDISSMARAPACEISRHGFSDLLRVRELEVAHVTGEVSLARLPAKAGIVGLLLADAGDRQAPVI